MQNELTMPGQVGLQKKTAPSPRPQDDKKGKADHSMRNVALVLIFLVGMTVMTFVTTDLSKIQWGEAVAATAANLGVIFGQAGFKTITVTQAMGEVLITIAIAFLTTVFSAIFSVFLALFAAENLAGKLSSRIVRGIIAFIRSVPTVLWVLIFAITSGLGSVAAIVGISFHSIGYLTRMFSESYEEMDQGVIEALRATGASWWQIVFQAVLPTTISALFAWTFMRFEINYKVALAMGAAAGAGGIGFALFMAGGFYYNMQEVGAITWVILISCLIIEFISVQIKNRLLVQS